MHELSIVLALRDQLAELATRHKATRVRAVQLEVGALSNVVPDLVRHAFAAVQQDDPLLQGATLAIREIPLRVACRACAAESQLDALRLRCPRCDSPRVRVVAGEDLILQQVELELPDAEADGVPVLTNTDAMAPPAHAAALDAAPRREANPGGTT